MRRDWLYGELQVMNELRVGYDVVVVIERDDSFEGPRVRDLIAHI